MKFIPSSFSGQSPASELIFSPDPETGRADPGPGLEGVRVRGGRLSAPRLRVHALPGGTNLTTKGKLSPAALTPVLI